MAVRRTGEAGFADAVVAGRGSKGSDALSQIAALVDWAPIESLLSGLVNPRSRGEPAYPPLVLFKAMLLQRWHGLSDPQLEAALSDRLSFLRFCGLSLEDRTPDHATLWRFRQKLATARLDEALMAELDLQLQRAGAVVRTGTLVDATLIRSAARRPISPDGAKAQSPADPDATFGRGGMRGGYTFGYKLHAAVDRGSGLIRRLVLTPANRQEVTVAPELLQLGDGIIYGDRGYHSKRLCEHLVASGLGDGLMRRATKNRPLAPDEAQRNHAIIPIRRPIEAVFGTLKRSYRLSRMTAFSQARNRVIINMAAFAYNLRRWRCLAAT
jgi:IS5 family transposase